MYINMHKEMDRGYLTTQNTCFDINITSRTEDNHLIFIGVTRGGNIRWTCKKFLHYQIIHTSMVHQTDIFNVPIIFDDTAFYGSSRKGRS